MAFVFLDREQVQQSLRRMGMCAITCVDDDRAHHMGRILGCSLCLMAHDDGIHAHGRYRVERIAQALTLDDAARARSDVHDIGAEVFARELERGPRPRARLIEQRHDGFTPQCGQFLDVAMDDVLHLFGRIQDQIDFLRGEILQGEDILPTHRHIVFFQITHSYAIAGQLS